MRNLIRSAALAVILASTATPAMSGEWYVGGTLGKATMAQWNSATNANRMATGADFFQMVAQGQGIKVHPGDTLPLVIQLVSCMNEALRYEVSPDT